jgi:2-iminobutanoate/2-iminopropanoate deaminase
VKDGKVEGELKPTGIRPTFMGVFKANGIELPPGDFGIPADDPSRQTRPAKSRWTAFGTPQTPGASGPRYGQGRSVTAGGMVYVSSVGPIDPETGQVVNAGVQQQTRQCMLNLKTKLEAAGSSLEKVVWANWSLRDPTELDTFNEEWLRWFPGDSPVGQGTLMPLAHRRAGFRVSIGVIAEA